MKSAGRILSVTSNFPRWQGDSTTPFVLHLAQDLIANNWEVDVLAPHAPAAALREVLDGVPVERFRYLWPQSLQTVCYQGGALVNLRNRPTEALKLPPLIATEWAALRKRLSTRRYDLLHSHWLLPQGFTGVLAASPLNIPHVATVHGGDAFALRGPVMRQFKRFVLNRVDRVTVNSSVTEQAVRELGHGTTPLVRIPMGVSVTARNRDDPEVLAIRNEYRRSDGPLLVFIGRIVEEKGVSDLLESLKILQHRLPNITAMVVGEGPERRAMEERAVQLGLQDQAFFTGWVDSADIPAYLAAADIFVGPSRRARDGWVEAQGLTMLEAMVAQTPVIATRVGGIGDSVIHEETGLLAEERSPTEIASSVERLMREEGLAERLTAQGYRMAVERFARTTSAEAFSNLFTELIAEKQSP